MKNSTKFWIMILIIVSLLTLLRFPELFQGVLIFYIVFSFMDFLNGKIGVSWLSIPDKYNIFHIIKKLILKFNNYLDNL